MVISKHCRILKNYRRTKTDPQISHAPVSLNTYKEKTKYNVLYNSSITYIFYSITPSIKYNTKNALVDIQYPVKKQDCQITA